DRFHFQQKAFSPSLFLFLVKRQRRKACLLHLQLHITLWIRHYTTTRHLFRDFLARRTDANGEEHLEDIEARYLVAADGAGSGIRRKFAVPEHLGTDWGEHITIAAKPDESTAITAQRSEPSEPRSNRPNWWLLSFPRCFIPNTP
ncbi:MAG: hypothetical protein LBB76_05965, partial [Azoarcus sp.]|nr:hypothetical protein [Azoarcus sp.]